MAFVVDKSLDKLLDQINALAPGRSKASDGSIGDPAHAAGTSDHNPQDTEDSDDGNDPDDQVDARDITHDPGSGCDIGVFWEQIRVSRDERVLYAIFNRRIFSSYSNDTRKAWEWGPYTGSNPHDKHGHISVNDAHNDETRDWKIGSMMNWDEKAGGTDSATRTFRQILQDLANLRNVLFSAPGILLNGKPYYAAGSVIDLLIKFLIKQSQPVPGVEIDYERLATSVAMKINAQAISDTVVNDLKEWTQRP